METELVIAVGAVMVMDVVMKQELASVIVQVYKPAPILFSVAFVPPDDHAYDSKPVPPLAKIVAEPLLPPLQETFVCVEFAVIADGSVTVIDGVMKQPLASVIVQL